MHHYTSPKTRPCSITRSRPDCCSYTMTCQQEHTLDIWRNFDILCSISCFYFIKFKSQVVCTSSLIKSCNSSSLQPGLSNNSSPSSSPTGTPLYPNPNPRRQNIPSTLTRTQGHELLPISQRNNRKPLHLFTHYPILGCIITLLPAPPPQLSDGKDFKHSVVHMKQQMK